MSFFVASVGRNVYGLLLLVVVVVASMLQCLLFRGSIGGDGVLRYNRGFALLPLMSLLLVRHGNISPTTDHEPTP